MLEIRSPKFEQASIQLPDEASYLNRKFNGIIASRLGDEYPVKNNIINLLPEGIKEISIAQNTNEWNITASLYENVWRRNALSIFTGDDFPLERELSLLKNWVPVQDKGKYLDVGCSSGLYARALKKQHATACVIALDFSIPMLKQTRLKAEKENLNIFLIRADARDMPFYAATFQGITMGGTLNELSNPLKVLYEIRRVLDINGSVFIMHLLKAPQWYKRILQQGAEMGGINFWDEGESNALFRQAGFKVDKQENYGMVCFSKLLAK